MGFGAVTGMVERQEPRRRLGLSPERRASRYPPSATTRTILRGLLPGPPGAARFLEWSDGEPSSGASSFLYLVALLPPAPPLLRVADEDVGVVPDQMTTKPPVSGQGRGAALIVLACALWARARRGW